MVREVEGEVGAAEMAALWAECVEGAEGIEETPQGHVATEEELRAAAVGRLEVVGAVWAWMEGVTVVVAGKVVEARGVVARVAVGWAMDLFGVATGMAKGMPSERWSGMPSGWLLA